MKYLFCTDGSDNSFSAMEAVFGMVKKNFVIDTFYLVQDKNDLTKLNKIDCEGDFFCENLKKIKEKTKKIIKKHGHVFGEIFIEHGDSQKIIEHINENFYNMLIFGSHNYKGIRNKIFGFARKIIEKSPYPVFIYHGNGHGILQKTEKRILLCVDDSITTLNAVISFMKNVNTKNHIILLTVASQFSSRSLEICLNEVQVEEFSQREIKLLDRNMDEIEKILCHNKINVKSKIHLRGNPSEEILNFVKQDFDLIVLGSHAREGLVDFLFGSVSKDIVDYANISVLIIPTKTF